MKCTIRAMHKDEWKNVLRFIRLHDTQDARYAKRYYREYFRRWGKGWDKVIIAEISKKIIGVSGYFYDNKEAQGVYWLGFTYIHPSFQGRGIGHQALGYVQRELKRRNARKLFLATSSNAIYGGAVSFYTGHGFRWEGTLKDLYGQGEDQIIMGKDLTKKPRFTLRKRIRSRKRQISFRRRRVKKIRGKIKRKRVKRTRSRRAHRSRTS